MGAWCFWRFFRKRRAEEERRKKRKKSAVDLEVFHINRVRFLKHKSGGIYKTYFTYVDLGHYWISLHELDLVDNGSEKVSNKERMKMRSHDCLSAFHLNY